MRRAVLPVLAMSFAVAGCGGDKGTAPKPPPVVARVEVTPRDVDGFRPGKTAQLTATAYDVAGAVIPGVVVSWSTSSPAIATVTQGGVVSAVEGSGFGSGFTTVTASSGAVEGRATIHFDAWSFSASTDPVNGKRITEAIRGPLHFRCTAGVLEAYVTTTDVTASGFVEYRFDAGTPRSELWSESTNFQALFYPGNKRNFASEVARSSELLFRYSRFLGGTRTVSIDFLNGLTPYLPRLFAACP